MDHPVVEGLKSYEYQRLQINSALWMTKSHDISLLKVDKLKVIPAVLLGQPECYRMQPGNVCLLRLVLLYATRRENNVCI